ncbi:MAG: DUF305 domain-containing protein [Actinobacteria bacterium]|nr:DUF305 domain-containing protein [Actinomycetota bacterium]MCA1738695.1 DUF305 domain-containing protein [Actinomycetota bacterium]
MRRHANFWLLALVLAMVLALASSCGGSSTPEQGSGEQSGNEESTADDMQGMDHSNMEMSSGGMDSGAMGASELVMENGKYSDERFIDAMVPHHQGAIDMAQVALQNAQHPEIQQLAQNIIADQQAEIDELKSIKQQEYGTSEVPMEMSSDEMKMMGTMQDPSELANEDPFDKAFIDAMIPHHESAIEMAQVAQENTDDPEIRKLAQGIVDAQQAEIQEMTDWRAEWYPEGER